MMKQKSALIVSPEEVQALIEADFERMVSWRQHLHEIPELTWQEVETSQAIADALAAIPGLCVQRGVGKHGLVALLKGDQPGPTVALRADMDALPIPEKTGLTYQSKRPGVMHACGHDGHMANLLGTALVLSKLRSKLAGTVKFIFQPAEEGGAGGLAMCEDGVLDTPKVDQIFGLHAWSTLPVGKIACRPGPLLAAGAQFKIRLRGKGGHAAIPQLTRDPILAAANLIVSCQGIVARTVDPLQAAVLSFSKIQGGQTYNVIPDEVELLGTLRALSNSLRKELCERLKAHCAAVASAHGLEVECTLIEGYPATVNHGKSAAYVQGIAAAAIGEANLVRDIEATMGSEDFSYYLERVPGAFLFLGLDTDSDDRKAGSYPSIHNPLFDFNDQAMKTGVQILAQLALNAKEMERFI